MVRNYDVIAPRIDDIIAERARNAQWDPFREHLSPPLTKAQLTALRNIYDIPMELTNGFRYNDGRWFGSEANWKSNYNALLGYLRDSVPRWDETYHPSGGRPTDAEIKLWNPLNSPAYIQIDLRREDCNGHLPRPLIIMHGAADPIVGPGEAEGYKNLVAKTIGQREAENLLAVYYIAGMRARRNAVRQPDPRTDRCTGSYDRLSAEQREPWSARSRLHRDLPARAGHGLR